MNKQLSNLVTASFAAALLLSGCGKAVVSAPAAQQLAARAAAQTAKPTFGKHLTLTAATAKVSERTQTFCLEGTCDNGTFTLTTSTFFPYYIPMFGHVSLNGKTVDLTKPNAKALDLLINAADVSKLDDEAKSSLRQFLYGLDFAAGH